MNRAKVFLLWFRQGLRLADNPALQAALKEGGAVVPVFIWAPEEEGNWAPGAASRWWLHQSLASLAEDLRRAGSRLIIRRGKSAEQLVLLARETGAQAVFWNRRYEPLSVARDQRVAEALAAGGIKTASFNSTLLFEPDAIKNKSGKPFQVFTPYWRSCLTLPEPEPPVAAPAHLPAPAAWPKSLALPELGLEPKINWAAGMKAVWEPGTAGAQKNLQRFLAEAESAYAEQRDRPDLPGTSRLSPHLHFGEISLREICAACRAHARRTSAPGQAWMSSKFLAELGWREFGHHLLWHFPHTPEQPLRPEFARFPWRENRDWLAAWQRGRTGYPFVDAGLRELWHTGWMHNRVRMVVASFLVKDLLLSWQEGARWFWDTLVDADLANNTLGWQWSAGCGADAAPYFRVFNPSGQGEKFDPAGAYVRRWVPELAGLSNQWIHRPWEAPASELAKAGIVLGRNYPKPVVPHHIARATALEAFQRMKQAS